MKPLRKYQAEGVQGILDLWKEFERVLYQLGTGGGKTRIIREIVDILKTSMVTIYIVAHRDNLVDQLSGELHDAGIRHGIIKADAPYLRYRVQVCSIQTLVRRFDKIDDGDYIIIDEAHHAKASYYIKVLNRYPRAKVLGMTATPRRPDNKPLSDIFQKLLLGPTNKELMEQKHLSDFEYFAPDDVSADGIAIDKKDGDFDKKQVFERVSSKKITGSAIEHYRQYADHKPAIVACVTIEHCELVAQQFREEGYKAYAIHSGISKGHQKELRDGLASGEVELLMTCGIIGEGTDIPVAVCLIWLYMTASEVVFLQYCGRVLRVAKDKDSAIILDHCGNWTRHGLPDDDRHWTLDGPRKIEKGESIYKRCPECQHPVKKVLSVCPYCGFQFPKREASERQLPQETEGKLVKIRSKQKRSELAVLLARQAVNFDHALEISEKNGFSADEAFFVWKNLLHRSLDSTTAVV